ncbi:MAG: hypothetical protein ACPLVI_06575 [Thermoplasmata archaeon]
MKIERSLLIIILFIQVLLLMLQFTIGMWINLFAPMNIATPPHHMFMMYIFFQIPLLMSHFMLGILIGLVSIVIIVISVFSGKIIIPLLAVLNGVLIFIAGLSGIYFVLSNLSYNPFSYIMALCFIGAVFTDFLILYFSS